MMKITGLSHLFKWENLHNWWLTKYFFAPLYVHVYEDTDLYNNRYYKVKVTYEDMFTVSVIQMLINHTE